MTEILSKDWISDRTRGVTQLGKCKTGFSLDSMDHMMITRKSDCLSFAQSLLMLLTLVQPKYPSP